MMTLIKKEKKNTPNEIHVSVIKLSFELLTYLWSESRVESFENDGEMSIRAAWYIPSCLQITVAICCFTNANELVLPPGAAT